MASINISERDFEVLACAAMDAQDRGDRDTAKALDKLARKMNAALTAARYGVRLSRAMGMPAATVRWQDMPSVLVERV
jgi:hypothetical protein